MGQSGNLHGRARTRLAFTLVEMLVVVGIIGFLIAMLMPALNKAQGQAKWVQCQSNEKTIGQMMLIYANAYSGFLFPPNLGWPNQTGTIPGAQPGFDPPPPVVAGTNPPQYQVWSYSVFKQWNPPYLICPADIDPGAQHSYFANAHLYAKSMDDQAVNKDGTSDLKYSSPLPPGVSPSQVIVLGEKRSGVYDMYMDPGDFQTKVEQFRHGVTLGSNYLMMDMHVESELPGNAQGALDPWDLYH